MILEYFLKTKHLKTCYEFQRFSFKKRCYICDLKGNVYSNYPSISV